MLPLQVGTVFFIMDGSKSGIKLGCTVCRFCDRNCGFAAFFGKETHGCITKSRYFDRSTVSGIDGRMLPTGDHTVCLLHKYTTFPILAPAEAVGRSSIRHLLKYRLFYIWTGMFQLSTEVWRYSRRRFPRLFVLKYIPHRRLFQNFRFLCLKSPADTLSMRCWSFGRFLRILSLQGHIAGNFPYLFPMK